MVLKQTIVGVLLAMGISDFYSNVQHKLTESWHTMVHFMAHRKRMAPEDRERIAIITWTKGRDYGNDKRKREERKI